MVEGINSSQEAPGLLFPMPQKPKTFPPEPSDPCGCRLYCDDGCVAPRTLVAGSRRYAGPTPDRVHPPPLASTLTSGAVRLILHKHFI